MNASLLDLDDVSPMDREKAASALARIQLDEIRDPSGTAFGEAYDMLASFFAERGEMEDRSALAGFVRDRVLRYGEGMEGTYHLITAREGGVLLGARDCYVDVDLQRGLCLVALSHSFVAPAARRSGVAAVFRALPVTLARRVLLERFGHALPTLVAAEMEPVDPEQPDTIVRLIAYGRSGFSVLDPQRFRYSQPDFRNEPGASHTGIALLGVVRPVGLPNDALPVEVVEEFPRLFHTCHRMYLPPEQVDASENHAMRWLAEDAAPVPLLPLPTGRDTLHRLAPLVRGAVLPLYPPGLRGPDARFGNPAEELAAILRGGTTRAPWPGRCHDAARPPTPSVRPLGRPKRR